MRFRINSVMIEGFKGFTDPQPIQMSGSHLFIFGPNGYGKSSIIEAIRWCLFGLTGRPEEIVRNQFYETGDCFVELELVDQNENTWRVQRRLSPGSDRSRMTILDPQGNERLQSEVFPFLTSLGPREGTYIVYGGPSQFPSRGRPLESIEISDFGKTIYAYLRLEEVPDLIERLNKLIEEQKQAEQRLADEIEEERKRITDGLGDIERQLNAFLRDSPWENAEPPTWTQTKEKIKKLVKQVGQEKGQEPPEDLSEENLLNLAQGWIQDLVIPKEDELKKKISEMEGQQNKIKGFQRTSEEKKQVIKDTENRIEGMERKRRDLLGDKSLDELRTEIEGLNRKIEETGLLTDIIKKSQLYLENYEIQKCFICSTGVDREELRGNIEQKLRQAEPDKLRDIQLRDELKSSFEQVTQLDEELEKARQTLGQHKQKHGEIESSLCEILACQAKLFEF